MTHRKPPCAYSDRNLKIYENLLAKGEKLDARGSYYYARELLAHKRYAQAVEAFEAFLAMPDGWTENKIDACLGLSQALTALGEREQAKRELTRSFALEVPRSAVCCALAALEYADNRARQAVFWYETAIRAASTAPHGFIDVNACAYAPGTRLGAPAGTNWETPSKPVHGMNGSTRAPGQSAAVAHNRRYFAAQGFTAELPLA